MYFEHEWTNPPSQRPRFENNRDSFREVLLSIRELAIKIGCENFAYIFSSAVNLLDGFGEYPDKKYGLALPQIPQQNLRMFEAASIADVLVQWVLGMTVPRIWRTEKDWIKNTKHFLLTC